MNCVLSIGFLVVLMPHHIVCFLYEYIWGVKWIEVKLNLMQNEDLLFVSLL